VPSNDSDFFERGGGGAPSAPRLVPRGPASCPGCGPRGVRGKAALGRARSEPPPPPPPPRQSAPRSLPYKVDTSRPSRRTNWTRLR